MKVSLKFLVLVQAPLSSHTEIAYNVGAMKKETRLVKSVFRENGRGRRRRRRSRRLVSIAESDFSQCNSVADRGASFCRSLTFTLSVFLLMKHTFDVIYGTEEYPFSVFTVLTLKAIGILLPMFIIIRTIATIQKALRRHQYPESEEDTLSSSDDDELEEEQQQHLA